MSITFRPPYADELIERLTELGWTIDRDSHPYYNEPWLLAVNGTMRLRTSYDSRSPWAAMAALRMADGTTYHSNDGWNDGRKTTVTVADLLRVVTAREQCEMFADPTPLSGSFVTAEEMRAVEAATLERERAATEGHPEPIARAVSDSEWVIPVSYRQLRGAGVELDSEFDEDAGEGDRVGEIVIRVVVDDDGEIGVDAMALAGTLAKPWPRWASCMATYYSAKGWVDNNNYRQNSNALMRLLEAVCLPDMWEQIQTTSSAVEAAIAEDDDDESED